MDKPLELKIIDFRTKLTALVNEYSKTIPAMFIADTINNIGYEVNNLAATQIDQIRGQYYEELAKAETQELKEEAKADET